MVFDEPSHVEVGFGEVNSVGGSCFQRPFVQRKEAGSFGDLEAKMTT